MSKKMRLSLKNLKVQSFVTTLTENSKAGIKGKGDCTPECTPVTCLIDCTDGCGTGGGPTGEVGICYCERL